MRVYCDIETYSTVDLKAYGVYRYAASPDFLILMCAWYVDGQHVATDLDQASTVARLIAYRAEGAEFVAHNAQFERVCFSYAMRNMLELEPHEWLPPEEWHDTAAIAGELGYPQSLAGCAKALGADPKDEAGTRLINIFCKPNRKGERTLPEERPMEWLDFIAYCEQDVETLMQIDRKLGGWPSKTEHEVFLADQRINDRGIAIDTAMARKAAKVGMVNTADQKQRVTELTGVDNPGSIQQMGRWAAGVDLNMPNWQKDTVERALRREDLPADQREVLELRQELALAAPAKFTTALNSEVEGRLRGTLKFFGAHTGRWAGRGTQVQNLPRAAFKHQVDVDLAIHDLMHGEIISSEELKKLVRPMFVGPFTVVDYAAIEARVIAWLADEEWALEAFRDGRDIYVETAERMGGLTRAQGKIAVLALGYNGGANSLRAMAGDNDYIEIDGKPTRIIHATDDVLYEELVNPWRQANSKITKLWRMLDQKFRTGGPVGKYLSFEKDGRDRLLRLPSGRFLAYRSCAVRVDPETGRERLTFATPQGFRGDTYGGRLAENATQAVARDIMAEGILRLEAAGKPVVAHVHDEILVEGEHDLEEIKSIMCESPAWATDMPIDGGGWTGYRYRKD